MVKYLLSFLTIFLIFTSYSFATTPAITEAKLKTEYGPDLTKIPWYLRFDFTKKYKIDWKYTYYYERKAFLIDYETNLAKDQLKEKAEADNEKYKEKMRAEEKKQAMIKEKARLKARADEKKAEELADQQQLKNFQDVIKNQKNELHQIEQSFSSEKQAQR